MTSLEYGLEYSHSGYCIFLFNGTTPTEIYTLSLHDALPIWVGPSYSTRIRGRRERRCHWGPRSEEHTSELQSLTNLVCRLLLEKKKNEQRTWFRGRPLQPRDRTCQRQHTRAPTRPLSPPPDT